MAVGAVEVRPEALAQQFVAGDVLVDDALLKSHDVPQPLLATESLHAAPEAETHFVLQKDIGTVMLDGACVTSLSEIIGERARERVKERYSAMLDRVLNALDHKVQVEPAPGSQTLEAKTEQPQPISTVMMFESAARGEQHGRNQLLMNVSPHTGEIFEQVGARIVVKGEVRDDGHIEQLGQTHEHRQETTLVAFPNQAPALRATTHAEGCTVFSIEEGRERIAGQKVGETSAMTDEADAATLDAAHFFLGNMTAIARFTDFEDKEVTTASVLLGGVDPESVAPLPRNPTEADRRAWHKRLLAARYDIQVFAEVRRLLRLKTPEGMTANQMLADAFVGNIADIDFAMLYDVCAAKKVAEGKQTFFGSVALWREYGEPKVLTRELYEKRLADVDARAAERKALDEKIVDLALERYQVLSDTEKENLQPIDAANMLRKAVLDMTVREAVTTYQDAHLANLGAATWEKVQSGREKWNAGDFMGAGQDIASGQETAIDPACPNGPSNGNNNASTNNSGGESGPSGKRRMKCPFCKDPNQFGDPCSPVLYCTACYAMVAYGKVKSHGDGGLAARKGKTDKVIWSLARMNTSAHKPETQSAARRAVGWLSLSGV